MQDIAKQHDKLWSLSDKNKQKRKALRERCALLRLKMKNKINGLH